MCGLPHSRCVLLTIIWDISLSKWDFLIHSLLEHTLKCQIPNWHVVPHSWTRSQQTHRGKERSRDEFFKAWGRIRVQAIGDFISVISWAEKCWFYLASPRHPVKGYWRTLELNQSPEASWKSEVIYTEARGSFGRKITCDILNAMHQEVWMVY